MPTGQAAATDLHRARLTAQLLAGPPASGVGDVVQRLLAVQAQDPRGARLAVRARSGSRFRSLTAAHVDRALADRELVVSWVNRGTLHLVRAEDWAWLHALTTPQLRAGNARRLAQEGVSPQAAERGVDAVQRALQHGPRTRAELRERVAAAGVTVAGQALVHVLVKATLAGVCVRGPMVGTEQAFVLVPDWLGESPAVDADTALQSLAVRYLAGHGPASDRDLARWSGTTLGTARRAYRLAADRLTVRDDGLVDLAGRRAPAPLPPPRLLGAFEPVLLGWTSRTEVTGPHTRLVTVNGIFSPFAMVDGRAVARWGMPRGRVVVEPLEPYSDVVAAALDRDGRDVERFLRA